PKAEAKPAGKGPAKTEAAPAAPAKTDKVKYDSVKLEIFNAAGTLIRTLKQKAPEDNGVSRMYWNMTEKGVFGPTRGTSTGGRRRGGFGEPSGPDVLPGTYKLRLTFGGQKDSTMLTVQSDPRLKVEDKVRKDRYDLEKQVMKLTENLATAARQLNESLAIVEDLEKRITNSGKADLKEAGDRTKAMKDSVNVLMDALHGKEDKRQGITMSETRLVMDYVYTASSYVNSGLDAVNETDRRVLEQATTKVAGVLGRVDKFFAGAWKDYRSMMEKVTISPFKDYPPLRTN
ncbi:MAG: hypothetical protein ACKOAR_10690, partial [Bacteroidota bacterium]